jgi:hypothetical protein
MSIFLILVNGLAALVSVQMLRPDLPTSNAVNFLDFFNGFLGVYQVFSSENWTDVLYGAVQGEIPLGQAAIVALFITLWMLFANCEPFPLISLTLARAKGVWTSHRAADVHRGDQREL